MRNHPISPPPLDSLGRAVSDATIRMHQAIARHMGLTETDHKYLSQLAEHNSLTAGALAQVTGLTTGAATGLIDRFERKGLLKREYDSADRRKVLIVPDSARIKALFEGAHLDLKERVQQLIATFSAAEVRAIGRYLTASVDIMNTITNNLNNSTHEPTDQ